MGGGTRFSVEKGPVNVWKPGYKLTLSSKRNVQQLLHTEISHMYNFKIELYKLNVQKENCEFTSGLQAHSARTRVAQSNPLSLSLSWKIIFTLFN